MDEWHEIEIECPKCGEIMRGKIENQLSDSEIESLKGKACAKCRLIALLESDLQELDAHNIASE